MRKWLLASLILMSIITCRNSENNTIIPRRDLVPLLIDMHIADAIALSTTISEQFGGLDSTILYQTVLEKYGYTKDDLALTLRYYSSKPEKLIEIYDDVFSELSKASEEAKKLYSSTTISQTYHIWKPNKPRYNAQGDTANYPPVFDVKIDTTGTFVLSVEIKMSPIDESVNPRILAYFYNPLNDLPEKRIYFEDVPLLKSNYLREYTLLKECYDTSLSSLRISIPMHDTKDSIFRKEFYMSNLRVALYRSDQKK